MKPLLLQHLEYTAWADKLLLDACLQLPEVDVAAGLLGTLRHIYYADRIWLARLEGETRAFADSPEPTLSELAAAWPSMLSRFRDHVASLSKEALDEHFAYVNLKGENHSVVRWQAVMHVVNHGTLHRGQAMAMIRKLGHQPPATDLLYFYLRG